MKKKAFIFLVIIILIITCIYIAYNIYIRIDKRKSRVETINNKEKIISSDLRIGIINFDNINPILSNNSNIQNISKLIFEPLINLSYDYRLEPCLATEWKKIDSNIYLIKLRDNVKWQDGKTFNSEDVIFTINILKKLKSKSIYYYNIKDIKEIKKVDNYTIKIITDNEIPYFEYNLIFPIMSSKYYTEDNFTKDNKNLNPVGTGMYYIEDYNKDNYTLRINENWWQENNYKIENIILNLYNNVNSALEENIDLITSSSIDIENYIDNSKYIAKTYIGRNYVYLALNLESIFLKDKFIRQAIKYSINKENIIQNIYNNKYIKSEFPLDFGNYIYNNKNELYYDIEKAKAILQKSKTENIKLKLLVSNNNDDKLKLADLIKDQLNEIGIEIVIIEENEKKYKSDLNNKNYDLIIVENTYSFSPSLYSYFKNNNLANYNNSKILKLLKNIENNIETDNKENIEKIIEYYNNDIPYISLFYDSNTLIYSKNLKGEITPNSYNIFYNIENWYREYDK